MAVSFQEPDALHVEVTVSANPIGYIGRDASGPYVKKRTPEGIKVGAEEWFIRKFQGSKEQVLRRREEHCPDRNWRFMLAYGNLKYPEELRSIEDCDVEVKHIGKVLPPKGRRNHYLSTLTVDARLHA
ncbi:MAG TPA: hypothetical protein VE525_19875 [Rubrobacter sp.]|nr:hypothetical protein [Rubrobacter sp.]